MKFTDRTPAERTAIDAWIRVSLHAREDACMKVPDNYKTLRKQSISDSPAEVEKMLRYYAAYQHAGHSVSYMEYFQVTNPEEYAAILLNEKNHP